MQRLLIISARNVVWLLFETDHVYNYNIREVHISFSACTGVAINLQRDTGVLISWMRDHSVLAQVRLLFESGIYLRAASD